MAYTNGNTRNTNGNTTEPCATCEVCGQCFSCDDDTCDTCGRDACNCTFYIADTPWKRFDTDYTCFKCITAVETHRIELNFEGEFLMGVFCDEHSAKKIAAEIQRCMYESPKLRFVKQSFKKKSLNESLKVWILSELNNADDWNDEFIEIAAHFAYGVLNAGFDPNSVVLIDLATNKAVPIRFKR